jgi:ferrous iron transport protein B
MSRGRSKGLSYDTKPAQDITLALAGNANVGKSAIFNQMTGLEQTIGNWPGKTVERAEGTLHHHGKNIRIIDLPGIYSFSTYSEEEIVTREYITMEHPDVVVNVVDATQLERNLFFTLQLIEMQVPFVIALNLVDASEKKGIRIDIKKLSKALGVPVAKTVAIKGLGIHEIADSAIAVAGDKVSSCKSSIKYGPEIEERILKICSLLEDTDIKFPRRWVAIKLLEGDVEIIKTIGKENTRIVETAENLANEIASIHKESCSTVIASERYAVAARISLGSQKQSKPLKPSLGERFDNLSLHPIWGYVLLFVVMVSILIFISIFGGWLSDVVRNLFESYKPGLSGTLPDLAWNGAVVGFYAALSVGLGFILPFYILLGYLEDSGYLPKIAYLMDRPCHAMGLHGKASIPILLAFGCNVPACMACRIMENKRDKKIAMFLTTLVPCSARTAVILGLVGAFVGWQWAVALYIFDFIFIFLIGMALNRLIPGTSPGIIMEMPSYRAPSLRIVGKQAWSRFREFLWFALPLVIIGSVIIEGMRITGTLDVVSGYMSPVTVLWLGLPAFTGILLIFGILRKEAALVLLVTIAGTTNIASVMSPLQMIVFSIVIMIYIPCISTIAVLAKEEGWKYATIVTLSEIGLAVLIGGIAFRILGFFM